MAVAEVYNNDVIVHGPGKTHYNFFPLKYPVYILYLTWLSHAKRVRRPKGLKAISQISQNHTSLSLVCSRPDGKREWNDAFSCDLRDSRETKNCVKREYFYNAFSLIMRFPGSYHAIVLQYTFANDSCANPVSVSVGRRRLSPSRLIALLMTTLHL